MLRRLEWIKNSGNFEDYRWDSSLLELGRINLIYGPNGSGKTSLIGALDATRSMPNGCKNLSIQVEETGIRRSTGGNEDAIFDRLHVFSESYITRSHRFHEGSPNIDAVFTLGERAAEAEEKIAKLREQLAAKTSERDSAARDVTAAERAATQAYDRVSTAVVSDLSRVEGYRSRGNYSAGTVSRKYEGDRTAWRPLSDADLATKKRFVASDNREEIDTGSFSLVPDAVLKKRAETLLATTPVTIMLDTLRVHPEATAWVQAGQSLHDHSDACLYCGQLLSDERKHNIEQHFSDEVARLQGDLDAFADLLQSLDSDMDALVRRIPTRGLLFDDLRGEYDTAAQSVRDQAATLKSWASDLIQRVRTKRSNVLESATSAVDDSPAIDGTALEKLCDTHNARVSQHATHLVSTAQEIERHHLKAEGANVDAQVSARSIGETKSTAAQTRIDEIETEIESLENDEGDPTPSAEVLTREVARLLGRSELSFQTRDGRYGVTRDGQPAVGLSVGERSAITLVHFLESVARHDTTKGKPIVIIDDPVSSLDSNVFMGISTYIWSETVAKEHVDQLVLLTHNFDLFKQWDVQIESLHRGKGMLDKYPASLYELKSRHVTMSDGTRRQPVLVGWPESVAVRKKIRSSYHHAFISVAEAKKKLSESDSLENRLDAQLLFPNVIRRILESFLAFKRPDWVGDFTASMKEAGQLLVDSGYEGNADALRQHLTRYAHAYSHSQTPETDERVSPDEISGAISSMFVFMNQIDRAHFVGLCTVVGIDPAVLLPEPVQVDSEPEPT